jgi:hypothetical protein
MVGRLAYIDSRDGKKQSGVLYVGKVLNTSIKPYVLGRNIFDIRKHITRIKKTVVIHGNKE